MLTATERSLLLYKVHYESHTPLSKLKTTLLCDLVPMTTDMVEEVASLLPLFYLFSTRACSFSSLWVVARSGCLLHAADDVSLPNINVLLSVFFE